MQHRRIGYHLLHGKGLEIGAFHRPAELPEDCSVTYCDVHDREAASRIFPELSLEMLAPVDVELDLDVSGLSVFAAGEFDFVVLNQVVEHLANPIYAIEEIFRVIRPGGLVVLSAHDKIYSVDKKRPSPDFDHLLREYRMGVKRVDDDHYEAFLRAVHPRVFYRGAREIAEAMETVRARREHAHTWDSHGFGEFLTLAMENLGLFAVLRYESLGQDNKQEYFSVWQKYESPNDFGAITSDSRLQFERVCRQLQDADRRINSLRHELEARDERLGQVLGSRSWRVTAPLRLFQHKARQFRMAAHAIARYMDKKGGWLAGVPRLVVSALAGIVSYGPRQVFLEAKHYILHGDLPAAPNSADPDAWKLFPVVRDHRVLPHKGSVDIIVCVHDALDDVRRCLSSLIRYTLPDYNLILVDDGSSEQTRQYLRRFAEQQDALLIRNDSARGYTFAANQGLYASTADLVVLLNSDTIATPDWLDRMVMCAESDRAIGLVGPLSNTASWQSVPELEEDGDWASNPLPEGVSVEQAATWVACRSARLYPRIPFLNGFCLMIKRAVLDGVGYFDEEAFGSGYGEENDYCLRARKAGWVLAVADDAYVYHAQSKSYSHERRKHLCDRAGVALAGKHGHEIIEQGVDACRQDRVLQGMRARARVMFDRQGLVRQGRDSWEGKRLIFVMPVMAAGGGANIVISEARAMISMGVDARILNLKRIREPFEDSYPGLDVPVIYAEDEEEFAGISSHFDAVIATANHTVQWLEPLAGQKEKPVIGYYIQDFEPYFYAEGTKEYRIAMESYGAIPHMVRFAKTPWNRDEVRKVTGLDCRVVGPSFEVDGFMPRRRHKISWPSAPIRICAMVRPSSERREPLLTMRILRRIQCAHKGKVEVIIFGVKDDDPRFLALPRDFSFVNMEELTPHQMAALLNEVDIFADFSTYQAMGLTAMEAMSCGVAVIVPRSGGASSFAVDEENALMVDTAVERECYRALDRLIVDDRLRQQLQGRAIQDMAAFYPERSAFNILQALFGGDVKQ